MAGRSGTRNRQILANRRQELVTMERLEEHWAVLFCLFDEDGIQPPCDEDDMDRWELVSQPCRIQGTTQSLGDDREQGHVRRLLRLEQPGIRTIGVRGGDDVIPRALE